MHIGWFTTRFTALFLVIGVVVGIAIGSGGGYDPVTGFFAGLIGTLAIGFAIWFYMVVAIVLIYALKTIW